MCIKSHPYPSWEFHDSIRYQCPGATVPKCQRVLAGAIWTWYYDDFTVICRKADEENTASDFNILGCHSCVHCQVCSFTFPLCEGSAIRRLSTLSLSVFDLSARVATQISSGPRIHCIRSNHCFCPSTIPECHFPAAFANISEASGSFCLQWYWVLAASRGAAT